MIEHKKAQIIGEVIKYGLVALVSIIILIFGYKMFNLIGEKECKTELAKFEIELKDIDKSLRLGSKEMRNYDVPCNPDKIYFFDLNKKIDAENFDEAPIMKNSLKSKTDKNVFLLKDGDVMQSFSAGNLEITYPYHICFLPKFGKISFFAEGTGKSVKITSACNNPQCTSTPINPTDEEIKIFFQELSGIGCNNCPAEFNNEIKNKVGSAQQNLQLFRSFSVCNGITSVQITINPKKNTNVKNFKFYEIIPKDCIDNLNKYLVGNIEGGIETKPDPLIVWYFDDIKNEKTIGYKLNTELTDECLEMIKGIGIVG